MENQRKEVDSLLAPFRVLDLTDEKGLLCGKILGDLGADVIKVERVGGDPARNIGPFYHDIPDSEKSLFWFAFNTNKRGVTLNIETVDGQQIFKRLVKTADFIIESFAPGYMDRLGLGYPALCEVNPRVIVISITAFGQTGPFKDYKASDIVGMAMGGIMYLTGDADRPPVRISFPQTYSHAGGQAAIGAMIAHYHRELTGEGQHVDVSIADSVEITQMTGRLYWDMSKRNEQRMGAYRRTGARGSQRVIFPCKDGQVAFTLLSGKTGAPTNRALFEWMYSEGLPRDFMKEKDWDVFDLSVTTQEELDQLAEPIGKFFMRHTKAEIFEGAQTRKIVLYPVQTVKDIAECPQLKARGFWQEVEHPELGTTIIYPGAFLKLTETPCTIRRRAPLIGEHNEEIYERELGLSKEECIMLNQSGVI